MTLTKPSSRPRPGLPTTLQFLTRTRNEAADAVLLPALDSPEPAIREGAVRAIVERRSMTGQLEVIRRLPTGGERWRSLLSEYRGRMTHALRDALLSGDESMCRNACDAALWIREYDLCPSLIAALEDEANPHAALAAQTLLALAESLYQELATPRDYSHRRDPQLVRHQLTGSLELSVSRFGRHKRREVISAFLMLVQRDNATLKAVLQDPHHAAYLPLLDELLHGQHGGVIRLLLGMTDDPHATSSAVSVLSRRSDAKFVRLLLRKVGYEPAPVVAHNLHRMESIAWLRDDAKLLDELDDAEQHSAVQMLMASNLRRLEAFKTIERIMARGKPGGRRAAAAALAQFNGAEANALALRAAQDADPKVQAVAAGQLRPRGIPGSLTLLVDLLDSPHEIVRQAARGTLAEFTLEKFLSAFDTLDEEVRRSTGALVKKVDPRAAVVLTEALEAKSRTRRLRALQAAAAMQSVGDVERAVIALLSDEDHVVRTEAARALGCCDTPAAWEALHEALGDRSLIVQQAAEESLLQLNRARPSSDPWRASLGQPGAHQ